MSSLITQILLFFFSILFYSEITFYLKYYTLAYSVDLVSTLSYEVML